jgi:hypothetical protein
VLREGDRQFSIRIGPIPRYYFHIRKGDVLVDDPEGIDVPETGSLEEEAVEAARDLLAEGDLQGLDRREWVYEVADETGNTALVLRFDDAVEPDLPPDLPEAEDSEIPRIPPSTPRG